MSYVYPHHRLLAQARGRLAHHYTHVHQARRDREHHDQAHEASSNEHTSRAFIIADLTDGTGSTLEDPSAVAETGADIPF